jgi:hypothetical protein
VLGVAEKPTSTHPVLFVYDGTPALPPDSIYIERVLDEYLVERAEDIIEWPHASHIPIRRRTQRVLLRAPRHVWAGLTAVLPDGYVGTAVPYDANDIDLDTLVKLWEADGEGPLRELDAAVDASRLLR